MIGANLRPLSEQLAEYFQAPSGKGVLVESVEEESAAEKAGMKAGDVIVNIGGESVEDLSDVWEILSDYDEGEKVDIEVIRKGSRNKLSLEIVEGDEGSSFYHYRSEPRSRLFENDSDGEFDVRINELPRMQFKRFHRDMDGLKLDIDRLRDDIRLKVKPSIPKLDIETKIRNKIQHKI